VSESLGPIATENGVFCVLALDHRDAMRNAFRRAGIKDVSPEAMLRTKTRIAEAIVGCASGILLDHATAAATQRNGTGLLVPLERQGHQPLEGGRLNELEYTATKAAAVGADGCKLLLHYRADHHPTASKQRELVARAAEDCHRHGLPLVLEPLVYRLEDESQNTYEANFSDYTVAGATDLATSGTDLLKLQYPGSRTACEQLTAAASPLPWALLGGSEVAGDEFSVQLEAACRAGASGFLTGRTIWSGALGLPDPEQQKWLAEVARPLFDRLRVIAQTYGRSIDDDGSG
jgi:tagatose 1,6-diphosphate aldolase